MIRLRRKEGDQTPAEQIRGHRAFLFGVGGVLSPKGEKSSGLLLLDKREQRKGYKRGQSFVGPETCFTDQRVSTWSQNSGRKN